MEDFIGFIVFIAVIFMIVHLVRNNSSKNIPPKQKRISSNIPESVLSKHFDEIVEEFANGGYANSFESNLILQNGERLIFDIPNVQLCEERTVKIKGGHSGFSVRIAKGVSYRFGGFQAAAEKKVVPIDSGNLILTSKRLIYSGSTKSVNFQLTKINTIDAMDNGFALTRAGKTKTEYYLGTDNVQFSLQVIPEADDDFEEETISYQMTGEEVKRIIQKLI